MAHQSKVRCNTMYGFAAETFTFQEGHLSFRGLFRPEFSSDASVAGGGIYPDHGLPDGMVPTLRYGEFLPPAYAARLPSSIGVIGTYTLHGPEKVRRIPACLSKSTDMTGTVNPIVSAKFRDVVEQLEPGVHQFIPVTFINGVTGEPVYRDTEYFYFNILTWAPPDELYDKEAMGNRFDSFQVTIDLEYVRTVRTYTGIDYKFRRDVVVRGDVLQHGVLAGKMIWRTGPVLSPNLVQSARFEMFARAEVRDAMKLAGVKGVSFREKPVSSG